MSRNTGSPNPLARALLLALALPHAALAYPPLAHRTQCVLARAPVDVQLTPLATATPGVPFTLRLTASARSACADVELVIQLPAGATATLGSSGWRGPMARGETHQLDLAVTVPDGGAYRFFAVARSHASGGVLVSQRSVQIGHPLRAAAALPTPPIVTAPDGTRLMELPANNAP